MSLRFLLSLSTLCAAVFAASTVWAAGPPTSAVPEIGTLLLKVVLSLGAVCLIAFVALRFGLAKFLGKQQRPLQHLKLVESMTLGPRRRVHLLEVDGRKILVGDSEAGLQMLGDLGRSEEPLSFDRLMEETPEDTKKAA